MPGQESAHIIMQSRIRDNQRRSRARQKEYIQELEEKVQTCERLGVQASVEIQQAARNVLEENKRLRALLLSRDLAGEGPEDAGEGVVGGVGSLSSEAIYLQEKLESHGSCSRVVEGESSEAIYLQKKLERHGTCSGVVGGKKKIIRQHTGTGQQMPLPPLQRNRSKPPPSLSVPSSTMVGCCGGGVGGGSSSKCGVPMSPAKNGDAEMRETTSQEGKVARILPSPLHSATSTQEASLSAPSLQAASRPTEPQPAPNNATPTETSLPLLQTPMLVSPSYCCGPNTTCLPPQQSPDVDMAIVPAVEETEMQLLPPTERIKPNADGDLWSSLDPDLRKELDPETDTTSCAFAVSIIASMHSGVDLDDVQKALGCGADNLNECKVENSRLFVAVDRFTE